MLELRHAFTAFRLGLTALLLPLLLILILLILVWMTSGGADVEMPPHEILEPPVGINLLDAGIRKVKLRAAPDYEAGRFKRWVRGDGYRDAWTAAVEVPVLLLDTARGGLKPDDPGGGYQTLSLDLIDSSGQVYTLRSVNKNVSRLLPRWARWLGVESIITDGISASHPYGASVAASLSDLAGVPHMHPKLYWLPVQPLLDTFNENLGDKLMWLEYEPEGKRADWLQLPGFKGWHDSEELLEIKDENPDIWIDTALLLRARLFDIWTGDWDRHSGQWGWAEWGHGQRRFSAIPNDRDNIFYGVGGLVPGLISRFETRLQPFGKTVRSMEGLTSNSKFFDWQFLGQVPLEDFVEEASSLQNSLDSAGIDRALRQWPPEVYDVYGAAIREALLERREDLIDYARQFHDIIQKRGPVLEKDNT